MKQLVVDPLLAGEVDLHQRAPAILRHLGDRAVAGDAGVVDHQVDAAGEPLCDRGRGVRIGDVELDRLRLQPLGNCLQLLREGRDVEQGQLGAVAAQDGGDRFADPARGAGDQRLHAVQRLFPFELRRLGDGWADSNHLAGDIGGAGGEEEAQGGVELVLGAGCNVDELRRDAAADLLAQRAGEALQRPLGGGRAGRAPVELEIPVASKTSALTGLSDISARGASISASSRSSCLPSLPPGAAPIRTAPAFSLVSGEWRSSSTGRGRPTRGAISRPGGELTSCA